jgi:pyrophosphatase PpaX
MGPLRRSFAAYLFDLDGTLLDSVDLILRAYRTAVETHLGFSPPDSQILDRLGMPLEAQLAAFSADPDDIVAMRAIYREFYRRHHDQNVREFPGARESVRALKARGARLGVVTSKRRSGTRRGLEICGFDGLFDAIVTAEDVTRHKPDPTPVLRALELLEVEPASTVFVGDSPQDLIAGRSAKVPTAAALWGPFPREALEPHQPDFWLTRPEEISTFGE